LAEVQGFTDYKLLGKALDDAAGEAFDKIAQYLGLGFPGGPIIDRLSRDGDERAVDFPRPMMSSGDYNFSFSGLKTSVRNFVLGAKEREEKIIVEDIVASFQMAVVDVLAKKTLRAAQEMNVRAISFAGGVSANSRLREEMVSRGEKAGISVHFPPPSLCTDNAAMIAGLGYQIRSAGVVSGLGLNGHPSAVLGS
jgi:N6-L-threonylcarbamoyladenine synthase